jgi:hypothetical protein
MGGAVSSLASTMHHAHRITAQGSTCFVQPGPSAAKRPEAPLDLVRSSGSARSSGQTWSLVGGAPGAAAGRSCSRSTASQRAASCSQGSGGQ